MDTFVVVVVVMTVVVVGVQNENIGDQHNWGHMASRALQSGRSAMIVTVKIVSLADVKHDT